MWARSRTIGGDRADRRGPRVRGRGYAWGRATTPTSGAKLAEREGGNKCVSDWGGIDRWDPPRRERGGAGARADGPKGRGEGAAGSFSFLIFF
jgi:hypothetical protein